MRPGQIARRLEERVAVIQRRSVENEVTPEQADTLRDELNFLTTLLADIQAALVQRHEQRRGRI